MTQKQSLFSNPAASILCILTGSLGDLVRGLCLPSQIKVSLPQAHISWLVEDKWAPLVETHAHIDQVVVFKRSLGLRGIIDLAKELRSGQFDITLDLQRIVKSGFFSWLSGAKHRIGFHPKNAKEFNWIFNNEHIPYYSEKKPKLNHYQQFTQYLGLRESRKPDFGFSSLDTQKVAPEEIRKIKRPFVGVVMGSSWRSKDWFLEGYQELLNKIYLHGHYAVVLLGDGSKKDEARHLQSGFDRHFLLNLVGNTSLLELMATLKKAAACVGPDSGPGHMAAAVGTPYVSLFGPTDPHRVAPYGCHHLVVKTDHPCMPCYKKKCPGLREKCMRSITAEAVFEKLRVAFTTTLY